MPCSLLLYADRVANLLLVPVAAIVAAVVDEHWPRIAAGRRAKAIAVAATVLLAAFCGQKAASRYLSVYAKNVVVTRDDFEAMAWIRANTPADAALFNLPGDSGLWIPTFAGRRITCPQGTTSYFDLPNSLRPTSIWGRMRR